MCSLQRFSINSEEKLKMHGNKSGIAVGRSCYCSWIKKNRDSEEAIDMQQHLLYSTLLANMNSNMIALVQLNYQNCAFRLQVNCLLAQWKFAV